MARSRKSPPVQPKAKVALKRPSRVLVSIGSLFVGVLVGLLAPGAAAVNSDVPATDVRLAVATAHDPQPYGGCDEGWMAPHSKGARECRSFGWIIRPRLVVGPHGVVRASWLPSCGVEDSSSGPIPCSWNFRRTDGNGLGLAYWVTGTHGSNRAHFVWAHNPARNGWRWVPSGLSDAIAESGVHNAQRNWMQCVMNGPVHSGTRIKCADGQQLWL